MLPPIEANDAGFLKPSVFSVVCAREERGRTNPKEEQKRGSPQLLNLWDEATQSYIFPRIKAHALYAGQAHMPII